MYSTNNRSNITTILVWTFVIKYLDNKNRYCNDLIVTKSDAGIQGESFN